MRILKSIAFCIAVHSGSLEAFELHFAEGKDCLTFQGAGQEETFLCEHPFHIDHLNLPEGLYGIKDLENNPFGFFVLHNALPGRYFQAYPELTGDVVLSFEGDWSNITFSVEFANGDREHFGNGEAPLKTVQNMRFDQDAKLVLRLNQANLELKMPLIPTYGARNPIEHVCLAPAQVAIMPQEMPAPAILPQPAIPVQQVVPVQNIILDQQARFTPAEAAAFWEMIRNMNPAYRRQKQNEAAFRNHVRPEYPNLVLVENAHGGYDDDFTSTQNAQNFAKWLRTELSLAPAKFIDSEDPAYLFRLICDNDSEFYQMMRAEKNISQQNLDDQMLVFMQRCQEELKYHFPQQFHELCMHKVQILVAQTYALYSNWLGTVNAVLNQYDQHKTYDKDQLDNLKAEYEALKASMNAAVIGNTNQDCAQKLFSNLKIRGLEGVFVLDHRFLEGLQGALDNALNDRSKWDDTETVMTIKPIAVEHHYAILDYLVRMCQRLGGVLIPFENKEDLQAWLQEKDIRLTETIRTALNNSEFRNTPNERIEHIHNQSDFEYMLFVASWVRCTASLLEQGENEGAARDVVGVFAEALKEQYRQCPTGMIGRMFTVLVNVLSTLDEIGINRLKQIHNGELYLEDSANR